MGRIERKEIVEKSRSDVKKGLGTGLGLYVVNGEAV